MLKNAGKLLTKGTSELKKSKSLENLQEIEPKVIVTRNSYHGNSNLNSKSTAKGDTISIENKKTIIEANIDLFNEMRKKSEGIEQEITIVTIAQDQGESTLIDMGDSYLIAHNTFRKALEHDCFYDIISKNDDGTSTIAFLPFSTSDNNVPCGLQQFRKIHLLTNYNKKFYITRIIFHKTMTQVDFENGEAVSKYRYQDLKFRKILFEKVQKDLDENNYSLLKDTDLVESNLDMFNKELPLVKFKFTDLE